MNTPDIPQIFDFPKNLKITKVFKSLGLYGAPEAIRTPGPQIRNLMLYPAELRGLIYFNKLPKNSYQKTIA